MKTQKRREVIFVQLIIDNFGDNHFSPLVIGRKQWREKEDGKE